jgi:hypothetical protein
LQVVVVSLKTEPHLQHWLNLLFFARLIRASFLYLFRRSKTKGHKKSPLQQSHKEKGEKCNED